MGEPSGRWMRVSTRKQDESITQEHDVTEWETSHGYDVKAEYVVHGYSAFKGNRTFDAEWAKVLKDFRDGTIKVLVVWKMNRIDRKRIAYDMIREVSDLGGRIEFVTEPYLNDLSAPMARVNLTIQEEIAYGESKNRQDYANATLQTHRASGAISERPPFGYMVTGEKHRKVFAPDPRLVPVVIEIFDRCIQRQSLNAIAAWLDSKGIPTGQRRTSKWSASSLKHIINNPAYIGYRQDRTGKHIGICEPLISADAWQAANDALKTPTPRGPILAENTALLSGVLYCPVCGQNSPMYRLKSHGPGGRGHEFYYRCAGRGAQRRGCGNMIKLADLDARVSEVMASNTNPVMVRVRHGLGNFKAELADIQFQLDTLSQQGLSDEDEDLRRAELRAKRDEIRSREPSGPTFTMETLKDDKGNIITYAAQWNSLNPGERNDWLKTSGFRVYAYRTVYKRGVPARLRNTARRAGGIPAEYISRTVNISTDGLGIYLISTA
jgi:DNA invertase Pin-like site-specific DNA recombinase